MRLNIILCDFAGKLNSLFTCGFAKFGKTIYVSSCNKNYQLYDLADQHVFH